jgi:hypothetical protein
MKNALPLPSYLRSGPTGIDGLDQRQAIRRAKEPQAVHDTRGCATCLQRHYSLYVRLNGWMGERVSHAPFETSGVLNSTLSRKFIERLDSD